MTSKLIVLITLPVAFLFLISGCEREKEEKVKWSDLPAIVQETILKNKGNGEIEEIEMKTKTENGNSITVYEAEIKKPDGKEIEIKVGNEGKLIGIEDD